MKNSGIYGGDCAIRYPENPLIVPSMVVPSRDGLVVECVLNPGAFEFNGRIGLLVRVAERPVQEQGWISTVVIGESGEMETIRFRIGDPEVDASDARLIHHQGVTYLTTLSHLRLAWSDDGVTFDIEPDPALQGRVKGECYGIEDARVTRIEGSYYITYTAVSDKGHGVGMMTTNDWKVFDDGGMILPHPNKDCAIFGEKIDGRYWMHHRPTSTEFGGNCIWSAVSNDLIHWGRHQFVVGPRPGMWDAGRVGAGAAPIRTEHGWLSIYHGATPEHRYGLGLLLLDIADPSKVLARSVMPIMEPIAPYEASGFLNGVVFTNGHIVRGDNVTVYYGAADRVICAADFSIRQLLDSFP